MTRYFAAALLTRTADEGARVALVLLALERTGSAAVGGTLVATLLVPHVVAAPLVGSLIDRSPRPGCVLATAVAVFATGLAASAFLLGTSPLWLTYLVLAVAGSCGPAITGGLTSRVGDLADVERRPQAFGLDSLFYNVASVAGPAGVALAATITGPSAAMLVLAGLAASGAIGILTLGLNASGVPDPAPASDRSVRPSGLFGGVRAIIDNPDLRNLTITTSLGQLGPGALAVVATVLAAYTHRPEVGGLLLASIAVGALLGSLLWTWRPLPESWAPAVTGWSMIGVGVPIAVTAAVETLSIGSLPLIAVLFGVAGFFIGPFAAALFVARNRLAPAEVRAQVFTIGAGLKVTASAAGAALIGFVAHLPAGSQLLIVAFPTILAGLLGSWLLRNHE